MLKKIGSIFRHPNIADQINKGHYTVMMPQLYGNVSSYFVEHNVSPIYEYDPDTQYQLARGTCTIAEMIDMFNSGYNFIILNDKDILDIYGIVDKYLIVIERLDSVEPEVQVMLEKIKRFKIGMTPEYKCACNRLGVLDKTESTFGSLLGSMKK